MIPLRIYLKGFLCYRDEQEILFNDASLWMLAGLNGSGKSAIFDAVTYALFGYHRGGGTGADELINHAADRLQVEFDFALDGKVYRARRTLTRNARGGVNATMQLYVREPGANLNGSSDWVPIENTHQKRGFDAWIKDRVGLEYETFTSSVLLLQGRSEKLLDAGPSGRFKVLAGIVDLDRYRRLHERADERRRVHKGAVEALQHQLDGLKPVTDEDLADADRQVAEAELARQQAQEVVERLLETEQQARQWMDLQKRCQEAEQKWELAQKTLADAEKIEHEHSRFQELQSVIDPLRTAVERRADIRQANDQVTKLRDRETALGEKLTEAEGALAQLQKKGETLRRSLDQLQKLHDEANGQLRELAGVINQVSLAESQRAELARLEKQLGRFPGDLGDQLARSRREVDRLSGLERSFPYLQRLAQQRQQLRQARERERQSNQAHERIEEQGKKLRQDHEAARVALEAAQKQRHEAEQVSTSARALCEQSALLLTEFQHLQGARVCRSCGQELTPQHFQLELQRRQKSHREAEKAQERASAAFTKAAQAEAQRREESVKLERALNETRDAYLEARAQITAARQDVARLEGECLAAWQALPADLQSRVSPAAPADWLTTEYPKAEDLAELQQRLQELEALRQEIKELEKKHANWQTLTAQVEATRKNLASLEAGLPGDVEDIRRRYEKLNADVASQASRLKTQRDEERQTQQECERKAREKSDLQQQLVQVRGQIDSQESQKKLLLDTIERVRKNLPPAWQAEIDRVDLSSLHRWIMERDRLQAAGVEAAYRRLQETRFGLEPIRRAREELIAERDRFPIEARRSVTEVQRELESARKTAASRADELSKAQQRKALLLNDRERRAEVEKQLLTAQVDHSRWQMLAQLLSRERLQRHLVRQAERQVIDHANAVLDRLSGGQLYLRLRGSDDGDGPADTALELEAYNRQTASSPINVAFLSGSQRFRVAVSLALGLGQFASHRHRPIESVIIDEGFGCLDRHGRQVMIQELHNLRNQLRCILLVSHQEEFADAFTDGYTFELNNGATRVRRFQR